MTYAKVAIGIAAVSMAALAGSTIYLVAAAVLAAL